MSRDERVGWTARCVAFGLGAMACLVVVGLSGAVFEFWTLGMILGGIVGVVVARFAIREARYVRRDGDPRKAARRGSWEP
ncbi:MAG: hypothetical protein OXP36_06815 [Gammaproteobacteria bacterium]|nr:hypothetical protein [Gammaproteobacteria bacterium]